MWLLNGVGNNSADSSVSSSGIPGLCVGGKSTMSSVAVLTQESFAEHRSGLAQQQVKGEKTQLSSCDVPLNTDCSGRFFAVAQAHSMCPVPHKCADIAFFILRLVACQTLAFHQQQHSGDTAQCRAREEGSLKSS